MEIKKIFYIILFLLIYNCESELIAPKFEIYLCSVSNIDIDLINGGNLDIKWQYPNQNDEGCDESAQYFVINYMPSETLLSTHPAEFTLPPIIIPFNTQSNNEYSYTLPIDNINSNYYFTIQTQYGNDYSVVTPSTQESFLFNDNFGLPNITNINCSNQSVVHDNDCTGFSINHSNLDVNDYSNLFLNEMITDDSGLVRLSTIALTEENINNPIERNLFLDYLDLCDIGIDYNNLYNCSELEINNRSLIPNISYAVEYYYSQIINDEEIEGTHSTPTSFIFNRDEISVTHQPISSNDIRIYIENNSQMTYYNTLLIWEKIADNTLGSLVSQIDISSNKLNNIFDGEIHIDITNINSDEYFIGLQGLESFYTLESNSSMAFNLLSIDGFKLIETSDVDFYFSTYELTNDDYLNGASAWQSQTLSMPAEINKSTCENYINDLNSTYPQYNFRLPNIQEWEYAAGNNIYTNSISIYPWGDIIFSDSANYYNSDYPLLYNSTNGISPVGYFVNSPSPFGIHDMSGNLMEWVWSGEEIVGKGGNYLSFDINELQITNTQFNVDDTVNTGMGCRILMENN